MNQTVDIMTLQCRYLEVQCGGSGKYTIASVIE